MAAPARIDELRKRYEENQRRFFAPLASEYRKAGDLELAIALCRQHLADEPSNFSGQIVFGQALYDAGHLDEARGAFEVAIGMDPQSLIALRHLGDIGRAQGDVAGARVWYQRLLEADRRNPEIIAILEELGPADAAPEEPAASADTGATGFLASADTLADFAADVASAVEDPAESLVEEPSEALRHEPLASEPTGKPIRPSAAGIPPVPEFDPDATIAIAPLDLESVASAAGATESLEVEDAEEQSDDSADLSVAASDDDARIEAALGFGDDDLFEVEPETPPSDYEAPDSPFGLEVDLGAAKELVGEIADAGEERSADLLSHELGAEPVAEPPVEPLEEPLEEPRDEHSSFGAIEIEDDSPFGEVESPASEPLLSLDESLDIEPVPTAADFVTDDDAVGELLDFELASHEPEPRADAHEPEAVEAETAAPAPVEPEPVEPEPVKPEPAEPEIAPATTPPEPFATETMADLFVRQGLRHEAIAVYKRLIEARPGDLALRARLYVLETEGAESPVVTASARAFLGALARKRPTPIASVAALAPDVPASSPPAEAPDELGGLFAETGAPEASAADVAAAGALAAAFGSAPPESIPGNPARPAGDDVSLDRIFREPNRTPTGGSGVPRRSSSLKFDQFFTPSDSHRAPEVSPDTETPDADDDEQFRSWLSGLKKP